MSVKLLQQKVAQLQMHPLTLVISIFLLTLSNLKSDTCYVTELRLWHTRSTEKYNNRDYQKMLMIDTD